jgi:hypothetical protein
MVVKGLDMNRSYVNNDADQVPILPEFTDTCNLHILHICNFLSHFFEDQVFLKNKFFCKQFDSIFMYSCKMDRSGLSNIRTNLVGRFFVQVCNIFYT